MTQCKQPTQWNKIPWTLLLCTNSIKIWVFWIVTNFYILYLCRINTMPPYIQIDQPRKELDFWILWHKGKVLWCLYQCQFIFWLFLRRHMTFWCYCRRFHFSGNVDEYEFWRATLRPILVWVQANRYQKSPQGPAHQRLTHRIFKYRTFTTIHNSLNASLLHVIGPLGTIQYMEVCYVIMSTFRDSFDKRQK